MGNVFKFFVLFFLIVTKPQAEEKLAQEARDFTDSILRRAALEAESPQARERRLRDNPALRRSVEDLTELFRERLVASGARWTDILREVEAIRDALYELSRKVDRLAADYPPTGELVLNRIIKIKESLRALLVELSQIRVHPIAEDPSPLPGFRDPELVAAEALMLFIEAHLIIGRTSGNLLERGDTIYNPLAVLFTGETLAAWGLFATGAIEGHESAGLVGMTVALFLTAAMFRIAPVEFIDRWIPAFVKRRENRTTGARLQRELLPVLDAGLTHGLLADEAELQFDNFIQVIERLAGRNVPLILAKARCETYL